MPSFEEAYDNYTKSGQGQTTAQMYDAQRDANLANMEAEYNRSRSQAQADAEKIAGNYRQQFNDLGAQYERQRRNYNQAAAANGINTGAASQAQLAQNAAYQRAYGQLGTAQAQEEANAARGLSNLESAYRSQVNAAIANADYNKANALLQGYQDDRNRQMQEAQMMAGYGIFDGYNNLYGADTANTMRELWIAQNPLLAYNTGSIDAERYRAMTGSYPPGYQAPASGGGYYGGSSRRRTGETEGSTLADQLSALASSGLKVAGSAASQAANQYSPFVNAIATGVQNAWNDAQRNGTPAANGQAAPAANPTTSGNALSPYSNWYANVMRLTNR